MCLFLDLVNLLLLILAIRSPGRDRSFVPSIGEGTAEIIRLFFPISALRCLFSTVASFLAWSVVIIGLLASAVIEDILVRQYFQPRFAATMQKEVLLPFVESWRNAAPVAEIPIDTEGSVFERDYAIGSPDAVLTIVGFSDYECPYCKLMATYIKHVLEKNSGKVRYISKDYPLDMSCNSAIKAPKHEYACLAARFSRCAGAQGQEFYWKANQAIYDSPHLSEDTLQGLMRDIGVVTEELDLCLRSTEVRDRVVQDVHLGHALNIMGTPALFFNGRPLQVPVQFLPGVIKMLLEEVESQKKLSRSETSDRESEEAAAR